MKQLSKIALLLLITLPGLALAMPIPEEATSACKSTTLATGQIDQKTHWLFALRAQNGVISQGAQGETLTLTELDPQVLYFSDRPVRKAGFEPVGYFIKNWTRGINSFQKNPPNASITHANLPTDRDGTSQDIPIQLSNPTLDKDGSLRFKLKRLMGHQVMSNNYNDVVLYIDGESTCPCTHTAGPNQCNCYWLGSKFCNCPPGPRG